MGHYETLQNCVYASKIYKTNCLNGFIGKHISSENRTPRAPRKFEVGSRQKK